MVTRFSDYNDYALDYHLRGEAGELARREAQQELYERGVASVEPMSETEMVDELRARGYVVFKPRHR